MDNRNLDWDYLVDGDLLNIEAALTESSAPVYPTWQEHLQPLTSLNVDEYDRVSLGYHLPFVKLLDFDNEIRNCTADDLFGIGFIPSGSDYIPQMPGGNDAEGMDQVAINFTPVSLAMKGWSESYSILDAAREQQELLPIKHELDDTIWNRGEVDLDSFDTLSSFYFAEEELQAAFASPSDTKNYWENVFHSIQALVSREPLETTPADLFAADQDEEKAFSRKAIRALRRTSSRKGSRRALQRLENQPGRDIFNYNEQEEKDADPWTALHLPLRFQVKNGELICRVNLEALREDGRLKAFLSNTNLEQVKGEMEKFIEGKEADLRMLLPRSRKKKAQ